MVADTRAVMAADMAEAAAMAGVMVSMAHHSSFARVLAAGGTPTANASAGGDIRFDRRRLRRRRKQDQGRAGQPARPFFFGPPLVLPDCFHPAISGGLATPGLEHYRF